MLGRFTCFYDPVTVVSSVEDIGEGVVVVLCCIRMMLVCTPGCSGG